ncbi:glycoside hydrolase family 5 protein [Chitinivibrio alkaliphilus]|uniref:Glycoside hydrolase, GH5 family n=1 Tax=Chitinivibrio alkaliphilus ACht1 TaxID=1313304 RepID=U7DE87_9BACT|nr:cellulase family glycosylhydrolase [Chitinivibrio alkaliphilus]ERP39236.1 glycoside hydrolase, GH5 family [Chitinivibrio alkaliphilus ACht1]
MKIILLNDRQKAEMKYPYTASICILFLLLPLCADQLPRLRVSGDSIITVQGTSVSFRGLHITTEAWGQWEYPQSDSLAARGKYPFIPHRNIPKYALEERDFDSIAALSPFLVRYELAYSHFSEDTPERDANMQVLQRHIKEFNRRGIYVVPVLHFGPGLHLAKAHYEDAKHGDERVQTIFEDRDTFVRHRDWWVYVAGHLAELPGVAAYQLYVEPRIPSREEGGYTVFAERTQELCDAIRAIDPHTILVLHTAFSREANPGESYWSNEENAFRTDTGEQGIIWSGSPEFITEDISYFTYIDDPNIVYAFSAYVPYEFCSKGAQSTSGNPFTADYFAEKMKDFIEPRLAFREKLSVPVIVDEFGVNHLQSREMAEIWLASVLDVFEAKEVPAWFYQYKGLSDPYSGGENNYGIYTYTRLSSHEIQMSDSSYRFAPFAREAAEKTGYDTLFHNYFWKGGDFRTLSITNNESIREIIKGYFNK